MKAIFIDAKNAQIKEIDHSGKLEDIYKTIGVRHIEAVFFGKDHIYVDEEGRINGTSFGFHVNGIEIYGNGLLLGDDGKGDEADHTSDINRVEESIDWFFVL